jgi:CDP-glucose 4,6-dehydratase
MGQRRRAVEDLGMSPGFWDGRRVFVTGHTGFKGSWLALWLCNAGAQVHGFALEPPTEPSLFDVARVGTTLASHTVGDIRDAGALRHALVAAAPEIVFHLAAQPLVRHSYVEPVETYAVNVLGTVHLFEAVRACSAVRAVVNVTTDKCYENPEHARHFRESDPLGGRDPYSNSKACSELVTAAYRDSFLAAAGVAVATARAGNVIGGGDWAADRLLPDFFRASSHGRTTAVRHPDAVRPWQHVLEPLAGYLLLAQRLVEQGQAAAGAWNFGPADADAKPVRWVLDYLAARMAGARWQAEPGPQVHEAQHLALDSAKARAQLGWTPAWGLATALDRTIEWHDAWRAKRDMRALCLAQIEARQTAAAV